MNLSGEISVKAPRAKIFDALRDPYFFASCIEGVHDLTQLDANRYDAVLETKVAYIQFKFKVVIEMTRIDAPHEIEAKVEGVPLGVVGRLAATSVTRLIEEGDSTRIQYSIAASLTGKLGALGQPVMKAKAKDMERQFVTRLRAAFEETAPAVTPT